LPRIKVREKEQRAEESQGDSEQPQSGREGGRTKTSTKKKISER